MFGEPVVPQRNPSPIDYDRILTWIIDKATKARSRNLQAARDGKTASLFFDFASICEMSSKVCESINYDAVHGAPDEEGKAANAGE